MSDKTHPLPKAKIQKDALSWFFWTLPVGAAALCGWFLLHDFVFAGPTVTIYFDQADGLQVQNTMVKYRGINIGQVESLKLADGGQRVAVRAKLQHFATDLARQGSVFWIVRPELKLGAISGLRTIVSGNYVTVQPGGGARTNVFVGAEQAPIQPIPSINITLLADNLGSLENQSPVFYRGIQVGEVMDFQLGKNAENVIVHARIRQDYAPLVRVDSKFWNAGGINVHVGLFSGLEMNAESAQTLVSGGVAFATPEKYGAPATNGTVLLLNDKEDTSWEQWNPIIPLGAMPEGEKSKNSIPQIQPE
jgi:paraquat-inducible protein B